MTLLLNDLQLNTLYTCVLSNLTILVTSKTEVNKTTTVTGRYYNPVTGRYENIALINNQVAELVQPTSKK